MPRWYNLQSTNCFEFGILNTDLLIYFKMSVLLKKFSCFKVGVLLKRAAYYAQGSMSNRTFGAETVTSKALFYECSENDMNGNEIPMSLFVGSVIIVVNVASQ